jgi:hypothetical protein
MFNKNGTMEKVKYMCHVRTEMFPSYIPIQRFLEVSHIHPKSPKTKEIPHSPEVTEPHMLWILTFHD